MNRRTFIQNSARGLGAAILAPEVLAAHKCVPASDQVNVGVIGVGSRGQWLMQHLLQVPGARITALCDVYEQRLAEGRQIAGAKAVGYRDYREMLEKERGLDAVIIATPLRAHGEQVIAALAGGLHVYGEKAMAYHLDECERIVAAAREHRRHFQIGHQYRYAPWCRKALALLAAKEIGRVTHVFAYWHRNNNWRRPVPDWGDEKVINWRLYLEHSRGLLAELGSHHIDLANWAFDDQPVSVSGNGKITYYHDGRETFDNLQAIFNYANGGTLVFSSLLGNHREGFQVWLVGTGGSIQITLQDATVYYEPRRANSAVPEAMGALDAVTGATMIATGDMPYRGPGKRIEIPKEENIQQDLLALGAFVESIREDKRPFADERVGFAATIPVILGHQAIREGRRVDFAAQLGGNASK
jgi:predicted dehydrogenase